MIQLDNNQTLLVDQIRQQFSQLAGAIRLCTNLPAVPIESIEFASDSPTKYVLWAIPLKQGNPFNPEDGTLPQVPDTDLSFLAWELGRNKNALVGALALHSDSVWSFHLQLFDGEPRMIHQVFVGNGNPDWFTPRIAATFVHEIQRIIALNQLETRIALIFPQKRVIC